MRPTSGRTPDPGGFVPGQRITTTGWGRTARWGPAAGTVVAVRDGSVFVRWDGGFVEDEMDPREVRAL